MDAALAAGVGGFIVFGGTVSELGALTEKLRRAAGRPLLIGADLERGPGQQVAGLPELPPPLALASLDDPSVARDAGWITASGARQVGINWVFAPVADLDVEAENPIVQTRSFGADPAAVAALVVAWIQGAREGGALACAKHFPGHGRTRQDSHDRLPVVTTSAAELEVTDLIPFGAAIAAGVDSVMTAHVSYPGLDPTGAPGTRSSAILGRLRGGLGFAGLVVSDALIMEGFAGGMGSVAAAVAAVEAGVDLLLYPPDPIATIAALEERAGADPAFRVRVAESLERYGAALARAESLAGRAGPGEEISRRIAARLLADGPSNLSLRTPLELVIADDDLDGAFPPSPNDHLEAALRSAGVALGPGGSRIVLAFAEPRASKGRAGFGKRCLWILDEAGSGADLVILFGHPRLAAAIPAGRPILQAWHRQRLMQEEAARWIQSRCLPSEAR